MQPSETKNNILPEVQELFVNPEQADTANDLAVLAQQVIKAMSHIYAHDDASFQAALDEIDPSDLGLVAKELLTRESTTRIFDGKFMGQIHPQGNKIAVLASLVAAYMNTNTVVKEVSSAENIMESEVLDRLASWFGYDTKNYSGNITSGGSTANLAALWVSRERALARLREQKKSGEITGSVRDANFYVIASDMSHYSVAKACEILGGNVIPLIAPLDGYKTDVQAVKDMVTQISSHQNRRDGKIGRVIAIIGLAGETETGDVDDLNALADICEEHDIHFHVDAAYGGPFVISSAKDRFAGINRADSITIDPHKMIYTPYPAGAVLFRDVRHHMLIEKGMRGHARYLLNHDTLTNSEDRMAERNYGLSRVEGSMGSAGVLASWATMQLLDDEGLAKILDTTIELTQVAYQKVLQSEVLEPLHQPEINTLLIGVKRSVAGTEKENTLLISQAQQLAAEHGYYISINHEVNRGFAALRLVIMHPHTNEAKVLELLDLIEQSVVEGRNQQHD